MAVYGVKYRMTVKKELHGRTNTSRIDILKKGYGQGTEFQVITDIRGEAGSGGFKHIYENLDPKKIYEKPIQKSRIDAYILCQNEQDNLGYDGLAILEEIFAADESEFKMIRYYNDVPVWQGYVLPDLLEYPDGEYTFAGKITAKDFSRLPSFDIDTGDVYSTPIGIIAECLQKLGYNLPIKTYTTWTEGGITQADDILNQLQHNQRQLQDFSDDPDSDSISAEKGLEYILKNYGLIVRQVANEFRIYQISALQDASAVQQFSYDANGDNYVNDGTVDLQTNVDRDLIDKVNGGTNQVNAGLKFVTATFVNDNAIDVLTANQSPFQLPEEDPTQVIVINTHNSQFGHVDTTASTSFISDGNQYLFINGSIKESNRIYGSYSFISFFTKLTIKVGPYYLNDLGEWQTTPYWILIELDNPDGDKFSPEATFNVLSQEPIPLDAGDSIEITFDSTFTGDRSSNTPLEDIEASLGKELDDFSELAWFNLQSGLSYSKTRVQTADEVTFKLERAGNFSSDYEYGEFIWGDGPAPGDDSAIKAGSSYTKNSWGFRGGALSYTFAKLLLKEALNVQRSATRNYSAILLGRYSPADLLQYQGRNSFFLGGTFSAYADAWNAQLLSVSFSDAADTFSLVIDQKSSASASATSPSRAGSLPAAGGVTDHGQLDGLDDPGDHPWALQTDFSNVADWTPADVRFLQKSQNLADIPAKSTGRANLGLGPTDTPTFGQVTLNNPASADTHALRAGQVLSTSAPITGGGKLRNGLDLKLNYNSTDFKISNGQLRTAQRIDTNADMLLQSLEVKQAVTLNNLNGRLQSETYAGGFAGEGVQIALVNGRWKFTVDDIVVRETAKFYELVVQQLRANATYLLTEGHKVDSVQQNASFAGAIVADSSEVIGASSKYFLDNWTCFIPEDMFVQFQDDDLIVRQAFTGRNVGRTEATVLEVEYGSATVTDNSTPRSFTVSITAASDAPAEGFEFARLGNTTDPDRQGGVIITSSTDGGPYERIYNDVDSFAKFGKIDTIKSQSGLLDNLVDPDFSELDGSQTNFYGDYLQNILAKGKIIITGGSGVSNLDDAGQLAALDNLDQVPQGQIYAKIKRTALTQDGLVSLSETVGDADAIAESDGRKWAGETGADKTANNPQQKGWLTDSGNIVSQNDSITRLSDRVLDNIGDGSTYARVKATALSAGNILLAKAEGTVDDIGDGQTYGRVLKTALQAGKIQLSEAVGSLDSIADGSNYARVKSTSLSAGRILLSETDGGIDQIVEDSLAYTIVADSDVVIGQTTEKLVPSYSAVRSTELEGGKIIVRGPNGEVIITDGLIDTDQLYAIDATVTGTLSLGDTGKLVRQKIVDENSTQITYAARFGEKGIDFGGRSGQSINKMQWHNLENPNDSSLDSNSNLVGESFAYYDHISGINKYIIRAQSSTYNVADESEILLTSTRAHFYNEKSLFHGNVDLGGSLTLDEYAYNIASSSPARITGIPDCMVLILNRSTGTSPHIEYIEATDKKFLLVYNDTRGSLYFDHYAGATNGNIKVAKALSNLEIYENTYGLMYYRAGYWSFHTSYTAN